MEDYLNNDCISIVNKYLKKFSICEFNKIIEDSRKNYVLEDKIIYMHDEYILKLNYSFYIWFADIINSWLIMYGKKHKHLIEKNYFIRLSPCIVYKLYLFYDNILTNHYGLTEEEKEIFYKIN